MTSFRVLSLSLAVLSGAAFVIGCSGGTTPPPPPPQQQVASPVINPASGAFTSAQSVTMTDATSGATIYYTTDGSTPTTSSAVYSSALTISQTITLKALATAAGYTNSEISSATLTINIPPQTISLPQAMTLAMGTSLTLDSSIVTASASCDPTSVAWAVNINDNNKSTSGGSFASWTADPSNKTWGSIQSGNTFSQESINTYTVTAQCGTVEATSQLTVSDPAPTITAVSCSPSQSTSACVIPATTSESFTLTGTNFIGSNNNSANWVNQWSGTEANSTLGPCPTTMPSVQLAAIEWFSFTEIQQSGGGTLGLGTWNYYVYTPPTSDGTGGGWSCLNDAYTVVANSSSATPAGIVTLDPGTVGTPGTLYLRSQKTGQIIWQTSLDMGSTMATTYGDFVYVPNLDAHTVSIVNLDSRSIRTIFTGTLKPWIAAVSPKDGALYLVTESSDGYSLQQYEPGKGLFPLSSDGPEITDLVADSDGQLLYLLQRNPRTEIHRLDPSTGREEITDLDQPANQISLAEGGYYLYWTGEEHLEFLERGDLEFVEVALPNPIYTAHAQYVGLSDGTIWEAEVKGSTMNVKQAGQLTGNERFSGFVPLVEGEHVSFYGVRADKQGRLSGSLICTGK